MKNQIQLNRKLKDNAVYLLFTGPAMALFALFFICSLVLGAYFSLRNWNGIAPSSDFIGLNNYLRIFQNADFLSTLVFTIKYTIVVMVLTNLLALLLALGLNMRFRGRSILRTAFFTPMVISAVTGGYLWNFIVVRLFPMIGDISGIEILSRNWLANPTLAFISLVIVTLWQSLGYYMLIYLTGLQGIPNELVEAATIDGAGKWKMFRHITWPLIQSSFTICIFLTMIGGFKAFDLMYSLTGGGPFGTTQSLAFKIYLDAFKRDMLSYASAEAIVFSILIAVVAIIQVTITKRREVEL